MSGVLLRFKEVMQKYGRVAAGVHVSVSALCFSACYVAVSSSSHVEHLMERILDRIGMAPQAHETAAPGGHVSTQGAVGEKAALGSTSADVIHRADASTPSSRGSGEEGEGGATGREGGSDGGWFVVKSGGAVAVAFLCNKALFPVRVPVTLLLTPRVWHFLRARGYRV